MISLHRLYSNFLKRFQIRINIKILTWICFWAGDQWKFPTPKNVTRYR